MLNTLELTKALIERASVTPDDAGCQTLLATELKKLGFTIESLTFGDVTNLWARRGSAGPLFAFAGHTDVVPPGPLEKWVSPPFTPTIRDGYLYGRGVSDMKGAIAAMLVAYERFLKEFPHVPGSLAFLITSDEEGPGINGTVKVIEHLTARNEKIDWCLVGEPSSQTAVGDMIKNGRRGSLSGKLHIQGKQGHIAYPHLADNPIHRGLPALSALTHAQWDQGNDYFQPTQFQISNIHAGTGVGNVIPGEMLVDFNFRYSPETTPDLLKKTVCDILDKYPLHYHIDWNHSGHSFMTTPGPLVNATTQAIREVADIETVLSTSGGTSDGRFIAPSGAQVIELGLCNDTIHQLNERARVADLDTLTQIYHRLLKRLFFNSET